MSNPFRDTSLAGCFVFYLHLAYLSVANCQRERERERESDLLWLIICIVIFDCPLTVCCSAVQISRIAHCLSADEAMIKMQLMLSFLIVTM